MTHVVIAAGLLGEGPRRQRRERARAYPLSLRLGPAPGGLALGTRF